ncbi:hypothetical protein AAT19DRAFT_12872 [Rhodotorula toruloides]|uniref:Uncharacterized protein n=1 Tax=Rhodotorula toruloides TaxID=5286 RepID=A0A2T0ACX8_RHOTO|nr:hypothetical protein AAT19DRAFT_12872 [Rhodotorula toruloides]
MTRVSSKALEATQIHTNWLNLSRILPATSQATHATLPKNRNYGGGHARPAKTLDSRKHDKVVKTGSGCRSGISEEAVVRQIAPKTAAIAEGTPHPACTPLTRAKASCARLTRDASIRLGGEICVEVCCCVDGCVGVQSHAVGRGEGRREKGKVGGGREGYQSAARSQGQLWMRQ